MIEPGFSEWRWQPLVAYSGPEYALKRYTSAFTEMRERSVRYRMGIGPLPAPVPRETEPAVIDGEFNSGCGGIP